MSKDKPLNSSYTITVHTPPTSYAVHVGHGLLPQIGTALDLLLGGGLAQGKIRAFVVTSPELAALWAEPLLSGFLHRPVVLQVPAGEAHKRFSTVERLSEELAAAGADRDSVLIAFGGGVLGDLTGFVAAIFMRGIRFVQVPTTLLAQVDSSIGGKTGANLRAGKNLVGAFHQPLAVYADIGTLRTLPPAELRAGLQEAVKSAIIRDPALFAFLETEHARVLAGNADALAHVVASCVRIKAAVVEADEREGGLRMILNLGHTLGHAIEAATGYTALLHGEAIAWGMLAAIQLGLERGTITPDQATRMGALIRRYGPLRPFHVEAATLVGLTAKDKKHRGGSRSYVLPVGIGDATVVKDISEPELLAVTATLCQQAGSL